MSKHTAYTYAYVYMHRCYLALALQRGGLLSFPAIILRPHVPTPAGPGSSSGSGSSCSRVEGGSTPLTAPLSCLCSDEAGVHGGVRQCSGSVIQKLCTTDAGYTHIGSAELVQ